MKIILISMIIGLSCQARLHWTLAECIKKYGKIVSESETDNKKIKAYVFDINKDLSVIVFFRTSKNECFMITYSMPKDKEFSEAQLDSLVKKNCILDSKKRYFELQNYSKQRQEINDKVSFSIAIKLNITERL